MELLHKLALTGTKPQDFLYRLLKLKPEDGDGEWSDERNPMKEKDLLLAATNELKDLEKTYAAAEMTR